MPRRDPNAYLSLIEVVDELLNEYRNAEDWPADHRCAKDADLVQATDWQGEPVFTSLGYDRKLGYLFPVMLQHEACGHAAPRSLLARLEELIEPGQNPPTSGGGGKAPKGPKGSPAPWAARPAELLDEIAHGAIELHDSVRRVLGLPVEPAYAGTNVWMRGRVALRRLTSDLDLLAARDLRHAHHWLAKGECPGPPRCTIRNEHSHAGAIESRVRSWHRRARLVTGHEQQRAKVGQVENPNHPANTDHPYLGPICPAPSAVKACDVHESCDLMRHDRLNRYQQARCPWCNSVSLEQDPESGHVECVRPSCRDERGHRHMWTVEELAHLGLVIVTEQGA